MTFHEVVTDSPPKSDMCGENGKNGVYIDYMAYNAYFHVLYENPDLFFYRVTRYGFFKFSARI